LFIFTQRIFEMEIVFVLLGIVVGLVIGWLLSKNKNQQAEAAFRQQLSDAEREKAMLAERSSQQKSQLDKITSNLEEERKSSVELNWTMAQLKTTNENLLEKLTTQKAELEDLQNRFNKEFENLANKILDEKSAKFTEQNKTNMDIILNPLKEKIVDFEKKVNDVYGKESAERNSLRGEIKSLMEQNIKISNDANNLARALKGDSKKQGNWGEIILEKVLEQSGLAKDREYKTQDSFTTEEGRRLQPDVVVYLPDNKHIVVDAKVSLVAYEQLVNAATDEERASFILQHIASVKNHIRMLSEKQYQNAANFDTPDFVLLFMPIESSFSTAIQADNELFSYAWDRKIVVVSPTTLLATLRTIASIWKQERQTRNALEIAERAGKLYDKFVGFSDDLLKVGGRLIDAKKSYDEAMKKLSEGSGNLVSSVEKLRDLGAKASKQLPVNLIERADESVALEK